MRFIRDGAPTRTRAAPSFSQRRESRSQTVGEKVRVTINVKRIGSFSGPVTIIAPDTGTPKIVVNQSETVNDTSATFAFKIKRGAPRGDHPFTFKAKDAAGRERAVTVTLTVN